MSTARLSIPFPNGLVRECDLDAVSISSTLDYGFLRTPVYPMEPWIILAEENRQLEIKARLTEVRVVASSSTPQRNISLLLEEAAKKARLGTIGELRERIISQLGRSVFAGKRPDPWTVKMVAEALREVVP